VRRAPISAVAVNERQQSSECRTAAFASTRNSAAIIAGSCVDRPSSSLTPTGVSVSGARVTVPLATARLPALGRRVGRRSLAGGSGHSPRLNFRTTVDLYERAAARARREGKTVSQIGREALEQFAK
jgi:hypothetical protein